MLCEQPLQCFLYLILKTLTNSFGKFPLPAEKICMLLNNPVHENIFPPTFKLSFFSDIYIKHHRKRR
ncbi:hypothetical protein EO946_19400 [Bacillus spizizenii ATCC 6633 = JCM 2499]|nr:hypothetical protein [Bacillus spizizenii]MDR4202783.1 hypothetical protein [Bacillus spizizenii ATCC 6633 = JCM 2499]QCJ18883.1 hypothetical protein FA024_17885 [Bacillus subtilis]QCY19155.1 hypothetical protein EO946_19400 [Bacillus spizizenii ATCC 6633 = JCM 2499]QDD04835.1 hypothetical protein FIU26_13600 [Bacillus subtilis]